LAAIATRDSRLPHQEQFQVCGTSATDYRTLAVISPSFYRLHFHLRFHGFEFSIAFYITYMYITLTHSHAGHALLSPKSFATFISVATFQQAGQFMIMAIMQALKFSPFDYKLWDISIHLADLFFSTQDQIYSRSKDIRSYVTIPLSLLM
jgi:hypothetical protein